MSQLSLFKGLVGRVSVLLVFAVGAVGLFLMMGGLGEGQDGNDGEDRLPGEWDGDGGCLYRGGPGGGDGDVERWTGDDAGDFSIDSGVLTFTSPPDFEDPKGGGANGDNQYI